MRDPKQIIKEFLNPPERLSLTKLVKMVEEVEKTLGPIKPLLERTETKSEKEMKLVLPIIRISEKMWGQEGTKDREIIQTLLGRVVSMGSNLTEKIQHINAFLESPPQTTDTSEILTHIVLLDTLTNILVHFNAAAAGFTFEGFLSALLQGKQVPAGTSGIQDIIDNDRVPVSLKLLTEEPAHVVGSYRDLVDHFIDPGGLKQDPESKHFLAKAGSGGSMQYVVALKSFKDKDVATALEGAETIRFYQFDFNAYTFLDSLAYSKVNADLLQLPIDLGAPEGEEETPQVVVPPEFQNISAPTDRLITYLVNTFSDEFATELMSQWSMLPGEGQRKGVLVWTDTQKPVTKAQITSRVPAGSPHRRKYGQKAHEGYRSYAESVKILRHALENGGPEKFWGYVGRTAGYTGGAGTGNTQFLVSHQYYKPKFYDKDGIGYIGQINVGKAAVAELAQQYVDILNKQIFEIFDKVNILTNQINGYFVAGDKESGLAAAQTANEISVATKEMTDKPQE